MNLKNRILSMVLALCTVFSLCIPLLAEPTIEIDFKMTATPKHIFEMDVETIRKFFKEEATSVIFNSSITTTDYGMMIVDGKYSLEKIAILSFKITDANTYISEDPEADLQILKDDVLNIVISSMKTRQISTCIHTYAGSIKTEEVNDGELNVYLHIAFYLGEDFANLESLNNSFVKPAIKEWSKLTDAQKIIRLNSFILNGQFSYDIEETYRKSTVKFFNDKKGTSEDYAGLTALFLTEMGLENIIVSGQIINEDSQKVPHTWNMVKVGDQWYHLDILMNGPINKKGKHTDITEDYLLKATKTMAKDHFTDSEYDQYTDLATSDYTIKDEDRPQQEKPEPEKPVLSEIDEARLTLNHLLSQGYDIIMNHSAEYTPEAIKNLTSIYNDSREIYINPTATLNEIKAAQTMLTTIMSALEPSATVNKDGLFSALGSAYEMLYYPEVAALYPAASLRDLEKVYHNAVNVYTNDNATQNQVNNARWSLWSKINEIKDSIKEPEPTVPDTPTTPEVPETPTTPEIPDTPTTPETPETPVEPENPIEPEPPIEPDEPVKPDEPTAPEVPVDPVEPDDPTQPDTPSTPAKPTTPTEPNEEKKFSTDIILYALLAIVAAGGITFLIIDGAKKRKHEEDPEAEEQIQTNESVDTPEESNDNPEENDNNSENIIIPQAESLGEAENKESDSPEIVIAEVKNTEDHQAKDIDDAEIRIASAAEAAEKEREKASTEETKENTAEGSEAAASETESTSDESKKEVKDDSEKDEKPAETNSEEDSTPVENKPEEDSAPADSKSEEVNPPAESTVVPVATEVSDTPAEESKAEETKAEEATNTPENGDDKSSVTETDESQSKNEEPSKSEIEANQRTAVNILKQIKKRKKELNNHEKM